MNKYTIISTYHQGMKVLFIYNLIEKYNYRENLTICLFVSMVHVNPNGIVAVG
jgi:hypothetical protein